MIGGTRNTWDPEWVVDRELASALIANSFPEFAPVSLELLAAGWHNTVYVANHTSVFRFPRKTISRALLETELRVLPWLAPRLPVRVPVISHVGRASSSYHSPFVGYPFIPGRTITDAGLSFAARCAIARPLGCFLAALHSCSPMEAAANGAPPDLSGRLDTARRRPKARERLRTLVAANVLESRATIEHLLDTMPTIENPRKDVVVHGDLHADQILVGSEGELAGVLDWGHVHVGDPAVDFAAVHAMIPREAHAAFFDAYGPVDPKIWAAAAGRALWHMIALLAYAFDVKRHDMLLETRASLTRITQH